MAKKASTKKAATKTIVFTSAPPNTSYFIGSPVEMPAKEADEYIKLEYAEEVKSK